MTDTPLTAPSEPGYVIWKAWRDGMLAQGREVAPERMSWDTLPDRDKELDAAIEAAAAAPLVEALEGLFAATRSPDWECVVSTEDGECLWCDSGEDGRYPLPDEAHEPDCSWLAARALARHAAAEGDG